MAADVTGRSGVEDDGSPKGHTQVRSVAASSSFQPYLQPEYRSPRYNHEIHGPLLDFCIEIIYSRGHLGYINAEIHVEKPFVDELTQIRQDLAPFGYYLGVAEAGSVLVVSWPFNAPETKSEDETEADKLARLAEEAAFERLGSYISWVDAELEQKGAACFTHRPPGMEHLPTGDSRIKILPFGDPQCLLGHHRDFSNLPLVYASPNVLPIRFTCYYGERGYLVTWRSVRMDTAMVFPAVCIVYRKGMEDPLKNIEIINPLHSSKQTPVIRMSADAAEFIP